MSWLSENGVIVGTPVGGIGVVRIPLPGFNPAVVTFQRSTTMHVSELDVSDPGVTPPPTTNEFYPILSSFNW